MSLGQVIRLKRQKLGFTQDEVAVRSGISKPYLSNIETGRIRNPPTDGVLAALERSLGFPAGELMRLAHRVRTPLDVRQEHEALEAEVEKLRGLVRRLLTGGPRRAAGGVDLDALLEPGHQNVRVVSPGKLVPVINNVAAGYPQEFTDLDYPAAIADEYVRCVDLHDPQAFAARVVGDSMAPAFQEGDIVIFSPNTPPRSGDDCFVRFADDSGTTFKRFFPAAGDTIRLEPRNEKYPPQSYSADRITGLWPAAFRIQRLR